MTGKTPPTMSVEEVAIDDLLPDPANPRRISDAQLEALTGSLKEYGFVQPVLARHEDKTVIGGHQRLTAARRLGYKTVPVTYLDLTTEQARVLNLGLNKISGEWDQELLARLLADLKPVEEIDLALTGFSKDELAKLLKSLDVRDKKDRLEDFDLEAAEEAARAAPRAKPGEIWVLGDHRFMCGDSTNVEDVDKLFNGEEKASLLATDPPYLVDYQADNHPESKSSRGRKTKDRHWDDYHDPETSVEFFRKFLTVGLPHLKPNTAIYQWHADKRRVLVEQAWTAAGLLMHQAIIWVKARSVLTHSHFLWQSEPCLYGWVEGQQPKKRQHLATGSEKRVDGNPSDPEAPKSSSDLSSGTPRLAMWSTSRSPVQARRSSRPSAFRGAALRWSRSRATWTWQS